MLRSVMVCRSRMCTSLLAFLRTPLLQLALLLTELGRHLREHRFEDLSRRKRRNRLRGLDGGFDGGALLCFHRPLPPFVPPAFAREVPPHAFQRVALSPLGFLLGGPVPGGI